MWTPQETFNRMVTFIEQDAAEKVIEIEESAEEGFEMKKAYFIQQGCIQIEQEYAKKIKRLQMQSLIFKSQKEAEARLMIANCCYVHFQDVIHDFKNRVYVAINELPGSYEATLKLLIEQAILKVLHTSMAIFVQEKDKAVVKKMLPSINWYYKEATKIKNAEIKLSERFLHPANREVKVMVTALQNRVICESSLEERLQSIAANTTPFIKSILFSCKHNEDLINLDL